MLSNFPLVIPPTEGARDQSKGYYADDLLILENTEVTSGKWKTHYCTWFSQMQKKKIYLFKSHFKSGVNFKGIMLKQIILKLFLG